MRILDLHGCEYDDVQYKVENFIFSGEFPCKIITGNSSNMRKMVKEIIENNGMQLFQDDPNNFGSFVVLEKRIWK